MKKIKWGILSTAKIGMDHVIPAMQKGEYTEVTAIASRNIDSAKAAAEKLGIERYYGLYEDLLKDDEIDAIYNPLPNHLHFEWIRKSLEHGKHVLCEKPLALSTEEVKELIKIRDMYGLKVGEAFMVRTQPQWAEAKKRTKNGEIGKLMAIQSHFSYYMDDPKNIRNVKDFGGGGVWDIGCYPVHTTRHLLGEEPLRVIACLDNHPEFETDILASVIMVYPSVQCSFTVSTQMVPTQRTIIYGTQKKMEIEIPFFHPNDRPERISIDEGGFTPEKSYVELAACDQYTIQGDAFSLAVIQKTEVPVPLEDTLKNTAVLKAIFRSVETGKWEKPEY